MGSCVAGEFDYRFYSCLFAKCVFQMCSACEEGQAEEDLGVPEGKKIPARTDSRCNVTDGAIRMRVRNRLAVGIEMEK